MGRLMRSTDPFLLNSVDLYWYIKWEIIHGISLVEGHGGSSRHWHKSAFRYLGLRTADMIQSHRIIDCL